MFLLIVLSIIVLIAVFPNALFYTVSLLSISLIVLIWIACSDYIRTLMFLLIVIVYVGAMIIFIGYICAVSPNLIMTPRYNYLYLMILSFFIYFLIYKNSVSSSSKEVDFLTIFLEIEVF